MSELGDIRKQWKAWREEPGDVCGSCSRADDIIDDAISIATELEAELREAVDVMEQVSILLEAITSGADEDPVDMAVDTIDAFLARHKGAADE
jgi:hypothetical protein